MKAPLAVLLLAAAVVAENLCPDNWETEELLRHEDCNQFYKCTFGKPVEQKCFGDLYFNLETWQCDWPENVDCSGRRDPAASNESPVESEESKAPVSEEQAPEQAPVEPEQSPEQPEQAPEDSEQAPEESEQAPEEIGQVPVEPEQSPEQPEQAPEDSEQAPEESEQAPEETGQVPEESAQAPEQAPEHPDEPAQESEEDCDNESEEQQTEIGFQANGCPVDPHIHWLLPHENDCNQFYYCVWGERELRKCPASLHFNRNIQVCDWPADAGCAVSANRYFGGRA